MHILYITHYFPPEGNAPASRVYEMSKRWVEAGHQVTVITGNPNHPTGNLYEGHKNKWRREEDVDGIHVIRVWTYLAANKGTVRRILNYLSFMFTAIWAAMRCKRPDVMIATSPQFFCGIAGAVVRTFRRIPFVLEIRDIWPESISTVGALKSQILIKPLEWMERWMYRRAQQIVTVGQGYKKDLIERGVPDEKIVIISNGVNTSLFRPRSKNAQLLAEYGLEGKFICGIIGTIGMASGLDIVIESAKNLRSIGDDNIHFLIVGDGAIREQLEQEAKAANLSNVTFTGNKSKQTIPDYLATADVCLVHLADKPLFERVIPSKIFESSAMAKAIILGVRGDAAALITTADSGVCITPEKHQELTDQLMRLRSDSHLTHTLGLNGQHYTLAAYDRRDLADQYLSVLHLLHSSRNDCCHLT